MAVSKSKKQSIINELVEKIKTAKSIGFAQTNGITVDEFAKLRSSLREEESTYTIAKKTLIKIALKQALDLDVDVTKFTGQIGFVCCYKDSVGGLGKVNSFMKELKDDNKMCWISSIFEGEVKDVEYTKILAGIPTRETLLSRLVGSMKSPISAITRFFNSAALELKDQGKEKLSEIEKVEK